MRILLYLCLLGALITVTLPVLDYLAERLAAQSDRPPSDRELAAQGSARFPRGTNDAGRSISQPAVHDVRARQDALDAEKNSRSGARSRLRSSRGREGSSSPVLYTIDPEEPQGHGRASTLYRWRDSKGVLHYETVRPAEPVAPQTLTFQHSSTEAPGDSHQPAEDGNAHPTRDDNSESDLLSDSPWSVYLPQGSERLMEQLDQTLNILNERERLLQRLREIDAREAATAGHGNTLTPSLESEIAP